MVEVAAQVGRLKLGDQPIDLLHIGVIVQSRGPQASPERPSCLGHDLPVSLGAAAGAQVVGPERLSQHRSRGTILDEADLKADILTQVVVNISEPPYQPIELPKA
jgi:hypothetical protein